MKSRSRSPGHSVCPMSMSRTIASECLTLTAITAAEKPTLILIVDKITRSQRRPTMLGLTPIAITAAEKCTIQHRFMTTSQWHEK